MQKEEKVLFNILNGAGISLYADPDGSGKATIRDTEHNHLFYGNAAERRAYLRGIIAVLRKEVPLR